MGVGAVLVLVEAEVKVDEEVKDVKEVIKDVKQ